MASIPLARYLFARVKQLGVESIHGVPGDYNLTLLDHVEPSGLAWVGSANELNAGYAADGYARIKGVGALITTYGVGELSAINAIAGAFSERVPVVHIVGSPIRAAHVEHHAIHHTLLDGDYTHFSKMAREVVVSQALLRDPRTAPEQIDAVLIQCLMHSRPVYIEVPVDLVAAQVSSERLTSVPLRIPEPVAAAPQQKAIDAVMARIFAAKQPAILVDGEVRAFGIVDEVQAIVDKTQWPTWATTFGKGWTDETKPNCHGIYSGKFGPPEVQKYINEADLVLCFGPHFSSTNTYAYTSIPPTSNTILIKDTTIVTPDATFTDIPASYATAQILHHLTSATQSLSRPTFSLPADSSEQQPHHNLSPDQKIHQSALWKHLESFVTAGDILLGETGTAGHGIREISFPRATRLFAPVTWLSIGYMLPAAQGASLAQTELARKGNYHGVSKPRTVLFIGDGSLQMTIQEISTMIRHDLDVVIFVLNNAGYTIERCIHGLDQKYNDVPGWRYLAAPTLFGAREGQTFTARVETWSELDKALNDPALKSGKGLRMVEIMLDRDDTPRGILRMMMQAQQDIAAGKKSE